ncbi:hypothetical protein IJZ97_00570 [bacterium]|nr:hypothetical protein [bacterium]
MKKTFLILLAVILSDTTVFAFARETQEIYTKIFLSRFLKCIPCKMEQTVTTENGKIEIVRKLGNWREHKCRYHEEITIGEKTEKFFCTLSREQVNTLYNAMKSDPMGKTTAADEWAKVKKDSGVCTIQE